MVFKLLHHSQRLLEKQHNSILSAAGIITVAVFLSSLLGFIRTRLLVSYFYNSYFPYFESGAALDAYLVAFRIPDFVFQLLVIGALSAAFIPVYSQFHHQNRDEANRVVNSMVNLILIVFLAISVLIFIFARPFNQFLTGDNFSASQIELATQFTRIMLLAQFFFAISSFMTGIIQANQRFLIPALSPLAYNLGIIIGIVGFSNYLGLYAAAVGVIIGAFLHLILQIPLAFKLGYFYQPVLAISHPGVRTMTRLMLPRTLAISVDQLELFVVAYLATTLPDKGSYLVVTLAQQLMNAPVRIFGVPIGQASLPFLAKESAKKDLETFTQTFINSLHQILYLALPASAFLMVLRVPLVRILYGAKQFPWSATLLTGRMVAILSIGVFAIASLQLLTRAFYALHNTKEPFISALISVVVSVSTSWLLVTSTSLGVLGIALGSTLGAVCQSGYLFLRLTIILKDIKYYQLTAPIVKMMIASMIAGIFLWLPMRLLDQIMDTTRTLNLIFLTIAASGSGAMVYLWLSKLLNIKSLEAYLKLLDRIGNWQTVLSSSGETIDHSQAEI